MPIIHGIKATAAVAIAAAIHEKVEDKDAADTVLNVFLTDIQGIVDGQYGSSSSSIQSVLDNRFVSRFF